MEQVATSQNDEEEKTKAYVDKRTPAQIAFDKMQEKRVSYGSAVIDQEFEAQR